MQKSFIIILCSLSMPLFAQTDQERDALYYIHDELSAIQSLIDQAEYLTTDQYIQQFNYTQLRNDIKAIKQGIDDGVNRTRRLPRELPPISGFYH